MPKAKEKPKANKKTAKPVIKDTLKEVAKKEKAPKEVKVKNAVEKPAKAVKSPPQKLETVVAPKPVKISKAAAAKEAARVAAAAELSEEMNQLFKKWQKLNKQYAEETPQNYQISGFYDVKTPLMHNLLGWGVVLNRRENYIDVLFETGMKTLVMNYKG